MCRKSSFLSKICCIFRAYVFMTLSKKDGHLSTSWCGFSYHQLRRWFIRR
ncbi:Protein CONTINUOUS VASCULAR RING 1 [Bienertia sinuspersici]